MTNYEVDEGGGSDGPKAADVGVCEEGAKERGEASRAAKVGDSGGGFDHWHVKLFCKVTHHVSREPHHS